MSDTALAPQEHDLVPYHAVQSLGPGPALVFAPHPDDEVFGCAGALMRHVEAGDAVGVVILTDGEHYGAERRAEAEAAARSLGYPGPEFWGIGDRTVSYGEPLVERMIDAIERFGARIVYAPSLHEIHPDHRATAMAALEAVRRIGGERLLAMYEVGVAQPPNRLLDITPLLSRKLAAVRCFTSQLELHRYDSFIDGLNRYRAYTLPKEVEAAEAYRVVAAEAITADLAELYRSLARRYGGEAAVPDRPLVSVIVRTIGRPDLAEALDSIALQTWPRIEVVIVDALGAGVDAPRLCGNYPVRVVGTGERLARACAANTGMDAAAGAYLLFLDDDDLLDPDHIAGLVAAIESSPGCRAAYAGVRVEERSPEGRVLLGTFSEPFNALRLVYENYLPIHAVLFDQALRSECRFDESLDIYEDWDFWIQVSRHTPLARRARVSATYRSGGASGVSLYKERAEAVRVNRARLYAKWLPKWGGAEIDSIFQEYREVRSALLVQGAEQGRLEREISALRKDIEAIDADRERLRAEAAEVQAQRFARERAEEQAQRLEVERRYWESAHAELRARFDELVNSTTWRLFAPMRWLVGLLRR